MGCHVKLQALTSFNDGVEKGNFAFIWGCVFLASKATMHFIEREKVTATGLPSQKRVN